MFYVKDLPFILIIFLYRCHCSHLENLCAEWHFTATDTGRPDIRLIDPSQSAFPETRKVARGNKRRKEHLMLDVVMLALGLGFFAVAVGYAYACERL
jgi:hypothetical protein